LYSSATSALFDVLQSVELECRAVKEAVLKGGKLSRASLGSEAGATDRAESLRKLVANLHDQLSEEPSLLAYCMESVLDPGVSR
jgi:hypothetical protein